MQAAQAAHLTALQAHQNLAAQFSHAKTLLDQARLDQHALDGEADEAQTRVDSARKKLEVAAAPLDDLEHAVQLAQQSFQRAKAKLDKALAAHTSARRLATERRQKLQARQDEADRLNQEKQDCNTRVGQLNDLRRNLNAALAQAATDVKRTVRFRDRALAQANPARMTRLPADVLGKIFILSAMQAVEGVPRPLARYPAHVAAAVCESWRAAALHANNAAMWNYINIDIDRAHAAGPLWLNRILTRSLPARGLVLRICSSKECTEAYASTFARLAQVMVTVRELSVTLRDGSSGPDPVAQLLSVPAPALTHVVFDGVLTAGTRLSNALCRAQNLTHITIRSTTLATGFFINLTDTRVFPRLRAVHLHAVSPTPTAQFDVEKLLDFTRTRVKHYEAFKLTATESDGLVGVGSLQELIDNAKETAWGPVTITIAPRAQTPTPPSNLPLVARTAWGG
ncbi:hypothetical protein EXIGLDRAFT_716444 [Exidia glandulosa HHB12029]|uniref:F-box domain-containing protein n=1 Tax=Exidia glandulosa HHB12029 TaxID=1314781 RepID=A0A165P8F2_EXIGL|nr:hypothetical protein EXIGLDRAFT_716444 [Exidia glandulosa HHB12029]